MDYFTIPELPGKPMFRCQRRHANLQVSVCAAMWQQANDRNAPERLDQCRNCQIGARHTGVGEISTSPIRGMLICGRCHSGATRLVWGHLCVSCYNRQREFLLGRNAKGSAPKHHPKLYHLAITYRAGDQIETRDILHAASTEELVIAALRDSSKQVSFAFRARQPGMRQMALAI